MRLVSDMIRQATMKDLAGIVRLYDEIHDREAAGEVTTGWLRDVYPVQKVAEDSITRGDMFVQLDNEGDIVGTGIINQIQVDCYADGNWELDAKDDEVMVLHTLIVTSKGGKRGLGSQFLQYYEDYARAHGCKSLRIDTNARNQAARAFYKKHGYTEVGIVPTVFNGIPGVDLVLIEKIL